MALSWINESCMCALFVFVCTFAWMTTAAFDGAGSLSLLCPSHCHQTKALSSNSMFLSLISSFIGLCMGLSYPADEQQNNLALHDIIKTFGQGAFYIWIILLNKSFPRYSYECRCTYTINSNDCCCFISAFAATFMWSLFLPLMLLCHCIGIVVVNVAILVSLLLPSLHCCFVLVKSLQLLTSSLHCHCCWCCLPSLLLLFLAICCCYWCYQPALTAISKKIEQLL